MSAATNFAGRLQGWGSRLQDQDGFLWERPLLFFAVIGCAALNWLLGAPWVTVVSFGLALAFSALHIREFWIRQREFTRPRVLFRLTFMTLVVVTGVWAILIMGGLAPEWTA